MNIEREHGLVRVTRPRLIRFTDNIPRDCPSHLEWYQRLIDRIKTIRHEEYSAVGRTGNAWLDMDPVWRESRGEEIISTEPTPKESRSEAEVARRQPGEEAVTRTNRSGTSARREVLQEIDLTVGSPGVVGDLRQTLYEGAIFSPRRFIEAEAKEPSDLEEGSVSARQEESDIRLQNQQLRTQLEDMHKQMLALTQKRTESETSTAYQPAKPIEARGQADVAGGLLAELRILGGQSGTATSPGGKANLTATYRSQLSRSHNEVTRAVPNWNGRDHSSTVMNIIQTGQHRVNELSMVTYASLRHLQEDRRRAECAGEPLQERSLYI
jgi:hypothetical protein